MNKQNIRLKFTWQRILTITGLLSFIAIWPVTVMNNDWKYLIISIIYGQIISVISAQMILHRYFSHKSFKVNPILHKAFCILCILPGQGSPISWAAAHRHHHRHADKELDNHSPRESYWLAAGGWLLKGYDWVMTTKKLKTIPVDLLKDNLVLIIDRYYYHIWLLLIIAAGCIDFKLMLYFLLAPIGQVLLVTSLVTLGCHIKLFKNYRNYDTHDDSQNNMLLQWILLGDALHNTHHHNPNLYRLNLNKNEFDLVGFIIDKICIKQ